MIQAWPEYPFQGGVDLREQAPDSVGDLRDLGGEVAIEAAEHREFRDLLISDLDRAQRYRHRAGGLRDDERVPRVDLRLPRVAVRDAAHRETGQVSHEHACGLGDRDRERPDRCRLVNDQQGGTVLSELRQRRDDLGFGVRERLVVELLSVTSERDRVVLALADVEADEDRDVVVVLDATQRGVPASWLYVFGGQTAVGVSIPVTNDPA